MKFVVLAFVALALSACVSTGPGYSSLAPGATKAQVIATMEGCPSRVVNVGRYEARIYARRMLTFFQWAPADYAFILKDGVLVEFGEGTVRQQVIDGEPGLALVGIPAA